MTAIAIFAKGEVVAEELELLFSKLIQQSRL
jgi:hypothetical protein